MAKMDDENSASSSKKTGAVSKRGRAKDTESGKKKEEKKIEDDRIALQKEMTANAAQLVDTMEAINKANLRAQRESLRRKSSRWT